MISHASLNPVEVPGLSQITDLSLGDSHACALRRTELSGVGGRMISDRWVMDLTIQQSVAIEMREWGLEVVIFANHLRRWLLESRMQYRLLLAMEYHVLSVQIHQYGAGRIIRVAPRRI